MSKTSRPAFEVAVQPATSLLREVIEHSAEFTKKVSEQLEVNLTDFDAMDHLIQNGPATAGDLAKAVGIAPGSATVMIDRLVELGHVTREQNENDRRVVMVVPNPQSVAEAWKHIAPLIAASEEVLKNMSAKEQAAVTRYLAHMLKTYKDQA